jgi:hypothetical protein
MKNYKIILICICIIAVNSCSNKTNNLEQKSEVGISDFGLASPPEPPPAPQNEEQLKFSPPKIVKDEEVDHQNVNEVTQEKKVIKNGNLTIKSKQIDSSKKHLDIQLKKYNAYYESENLNNETDKILYTLEIRIPSINFEKFVLDVENGKDEIISKSIQAEDVTEEFVDIETRLKNKRNFLKRYNELLTKANTIKDMMAIEENIRALQEEIESKEGRLKFLTHQVGYSTLEINLFQQKEFVFKPQEQDNFIERVKNSISKGWFFIVDAIIFFLRLWPLYLVGCIIYLIIYFIKRKNK